MLFRPWQSFATFIKSQNCRHFPCNISDFAALIMNRKFDYFPVNTWSLNALRLKEMDKNSMLELFEQLDRLKGEDDGHLHQNRFLSLEATKQKLFCLLWSSQGFINEWLMSYQEDASQKPSGVCSLTYYDVMKSTCFVKTLVVYLHW